MFKNIQLVYYRIYIFCRRYLIIKKKPNSENVPPQIHEFERRLCAQTQ